MSEATCTIDCCEKKVRARGWCSMHYQRWKNNGDPSAVLPRRMGMPFDDRVDRSGGLDACWPWTGGIGSTGYGTWCDPETGKTTPAHRAAARRAGIDPGDFYVLHRCDNRRCCNPAHLFLGTHEDNMADMAAKGRARNPKAERLRRATHCKHGHEFTPGNTYLDSRGCRSCRACGRARYYRRKSVALLAGDQ